MFAGRYEVGYQGELCLCQTTPGAFGTAPEAVKKLHRTILTHLGSEATAENARGARVPPGWSGRSCARFPL